MRLIGTELNPVSQVEHPAGETGREGERLDQARAEFQAAWEAKIVQREQRIQKLRTWEKGVRIGTKLYVQFTFWITVLFPATIYLFGRFLCTLVGVAPIIIVVAMVIANLLGWAANRLEAREIKHL